MREPDTIDRLTRDLRALPRRERRAVLESLSEAERSSLATLLAGAAKGPQPAGEKGLELLSAWLRARLEEDDAPSPGESERRWTMTASTRLLLRQSVRAMLERNAAARQGPGRRSLAGAVGDLLMRKGGRP